MGLAGVKPVPLVDLAVLEADAEPFVRFKALAGPAGGCWGGRHRLERRSGVSGVAIGCQTRSADEPTFGRARPLAGLVNGVRRPIAPNA